MTVAAQRRMTLETFLTYDDGTETRYELEDGVLVEMGAESTINTQIAVFLIMALARLGFQADRVGIKQYIQVNSSYATARDPDLMIHTEASARAIEGRTEACLKLTDPNPLVVIEIVSPGTESTENYQRDYDRKPQEYAASEIPELWQIDPSRAWVRIGILVEGAYEFSVFQGCEIVISQAFSGLELTAVEILQACRL